MWISVVIVAVFFFVAARQRRLVPKGVQNLAESTIDFVQNDIILQTMGPDGLGYTPFLLTLFSFIFVCNIWEIIPVFQMPVTARIADAGVLAILVWVIFNTVGIENQGLFGYFKSMMFPPGVPWPLYILVTPIEFISALFVRPLSLVGPALRQHARRPPPAGHLRRASRPRCAALSFTIVLFPFSFALLVALTGFELLVAVLQAFIFTILTAVYIGGAMHPEH